MKTDLKSGEIKFKKTEPKTLEQIQQEDLEKKKNKDLANKYYYNGEIKKWKIVKDIFKINFFYLIGFYLVMFFVGYMVNYKFDIDELIILTNLENWLDDVIIRIDKIFLHFWYILILTPIIFIGWFSYKLYKKTYLIARSAELTDETGIVNYKCINIEPENEGINLTQWKLIEGADNDKGEELKNKEEFIADYFGKRYCFVERDTKNKKIWNVLVFADHLVEDIPSIEHKGMKMKMITYKCGIDNYKLEDMK